MPERIMDIRESLEKNFKLLVSEDPSINVFQIVEKVIEMYKFMPKELNQCLIIAADHAVA